mmetsp:Transcript_40018/g.93948  ORF Transcript_40018/g.93948 Transcript_40018/m.93948 type:complete len:231 (+) Transcript_40018:1675-2367(+)
MAQSGREHGDARVATDGHLFLNPGDHDGGILMHLLHRQKHEPDNFLFHHVFQHRHPHVLSNYHILRVPPPRRALPGLALPQNCPRPLGQHRPHPVFHQALFHDRQRRHRGVSLRAVPDGDGGLPVLFRNRHHAPLVPLRSVHHLRQVCFGPACAQPAQHEPLFPRQRIQFGGAVHFPDQAHFFLFFLRRGVSGVLPVLFHCHVDHILRGSVHVVPKVSNHAGQRALYCQN